MHGRADPSLDGVADYTARLARALAEHGVDVVDVPVDPGPRGTAAAARAVRAAAPDVAHVQFAPSAFGFSGWPGALPLLLGRLPLVTTLHEYGWWSWAPRVPAAAWRPLERRGLLDRETGRLVPAARAVLTTNDAHGSALRERLGIGSRPAPLLPNVDAPGPDDPVVADPAAATADRRATRRALGIADDAEVVVFFGFVHPVKGLRYLVDAVAALAADHPRLHILVVGGFTSLALPEDEARAFRAELTGHVEAAGAGDRVTITGHRPAAEVSAALRAADVAAFPFTAGVTLKSGSLLAALAHGVPTLVTRRGDDPGDPRLTDSETVVVAPAVRDAAVLADGLRRLLDDAPLRARVVAGGRALLAGHDWASLAAAHVAVYREVLGDGAGGAS